MITLQPETLPTTFDTFSHLYNLIHKLNRSFIMSEFLQRYMLKVLLIFFHIVNHHMINKSNIFYDVSSHIYKENKLSYQKSHWKKGCRQNPFIYIVLSAEFRISILYSLKRTKCPHPTTHYAGRVVSIRLNIYVTRIQ